MTTRRTTLTGLPTGFRKLDGLTSSLQAGDLILIVGRRSMGKTALALNIVTNVALRQKRPVGVISMTAIAGGCDRHPVGLVGIVPGFSAA